MVDNVVCSKGYNQTKFAIQIKNKMKKYTY